MKDKKNLRNDKIYLRDHFLKPEREILINYFFKEKSLKSPSLKTKQKNIVKFFFKKNRIKTLTTIRGSTNTNHEEYIVSKKIFEYLEYPFESYCSYYRDIKKYFNSLSKNHCIRQCIRYHCDIIYNCSCFFINSKISQIDFGYNNLNGCEKIEIQILDAVHQNCNKLCPLDCETKKFLNSCLF